MKIIKWILIVLAVLIVLGTAYLGYLGMFSTLPVTEKEMGPYTMVYEHFTGPYQDTGKIFYKVNQALIADGITPTRGIGIYYDDPKVTAPASLRSDCGSIVEEKDLPKLVKLKKYTVRIISRQYSIVAEFPAKSALSYMIGPMKGYPALMKYASEKKTRWSKGSMPMELYDMPAKKIYYIMGIEKGK
ncbi:MAG: hypothetical protein PHF84_08245 [bacterium]|nr:hypothetical protein [bacterium]